mgnify:CR=1 FL=1
MVKEYLNICNKMECMRLSKNIGDIPDIFYNYIPKNYRVHLLIDMLC